jgi:hypothetical protein
MKISIHMKNITLVVFTAILLFLNNHLLMAQEFIWAARAGSFAFDLGHGICTDAQGNIYTTGKYEMEANFEDQVLTIEGNHDIYTAKYGPAGNLIWVRTAGGDWGDYGHAIACDNQSNVYVTGEIDGPVKFNGSEITLNSWGKNDVFVAKYNTDGELLWAHRGGGRESDKGEGIVVTSNAVYVTGYFRDTAAFNNDGAFKVFGAGGKDIFIAKYSLNGDLLWLKSAGGPGEDEGRGITVDQQGNVYVCGFYLSEASFGGVELKSKGGYDGFLAKYDPFGNLKWVKTMGGYRSDKAYAVQAGNDGRIYITGGFKQKGTFGNISINAKNEDMDIFVACYTSDGDAVWASKAGGAEFDIAYGLATDANSDVYITGYFAGSADFSGTIINAVDSADIFVAKYKSNGDFAWVLKADGDVDSPVTLPETEEAGRGICVDRNNYPIVTGSFRNNAIFGNHQLQGWGNTNIFIAKIKQAESFDESTFGILNFESGSQVEFYPNPVENILSIRLKGNNDFKVNVKIMNMEGQLAIEKMLNFSMDSTEAIDFTGLAPGIYMMHFTNGNESIVKKVVLIGR